MAVVSTVPPNLSLAVAHTVSFLTHPLVLSYPATAIAKLRSVLEANLIAYYSPLWPVKEPFHKSTHRCIPLSPNHLPPSVIYSACLAAGVQWFDWISFLGGREFDLFVDPGHVSVRFSRNNTLEKQFATVWVDNPASAFVAAEPLLHGTMRSPLRRDKPQAKTLAQQLLEVDHEDDERLFALIADELSSPMRINTFHTQPPPNRSSSPLSTLSAHSRSSSRSSNSSSCFSLVSAVSSGSMTSLSTSPSPLTDRQSRHDTARPTRVFVDTSKTEVTPYDGGKTTVLTGGVMLGNASIPKAGTRTVRPATHPRSYRSFV